jgi:hypothetical protein
MLIGFWEASRAVSGIPDQGHLLDGGCSTRSSQYVTAMMEVKSSMGVIVAAPTAGPARVCRVRVLEQQVMGLSSMR